MSMNLKCKEVDLVQTPTYITYLCYYANLKSRQVSDWQTIRDKYLMWLAAETNRTQDWAWYNQHEDDLMSCKKLTFSVV